MKEKKIRLIDFFFIYKSLCTNKYKKLHYGLQIYSEAFFSELLPIHLLIYVFGYSLRIKLHHKAIYFLKPSF